ncbi:MAG: alpha/beta hydrolase, partial [Pseudonocardiaceae bacterium]
MSCRLRRAVLATTAMLATALCTTTLATTAPSAQARSEAQGVPDRYAGQTVDWRPCFPDGPPAGLPPGSSKLECSSFTAPRDWADPDGPTITIAVSRLRASGGAAEGALFTNPGGPG